MTIENFQSTYLFVTDSKILFHLISNLKGINLEKIKWLFFTLFFQIFLLMRRVDKKVNNSIYTQQEAFFKLILKNDIYNDPSLRDKNGFIYDQNQEVTDQIFYQNQLLENFTVFDLLVIIDKFKFSCLNAYFQQFKK